MSGRISVKKSNPPETKEVLAEAICKISLAAERLASSGLNKTAVVALLHDRTKISKKQIHTILNGLRQLEGWYCR